MGLENRVIAVRVLQIFEGIIEEKELEEGEKPEIYKQVELGLVPDAINHVDWSHSAVDVAGQLMSTLVLKHALPNANHRTSISLAEWYLESAQSGFSLPQLATDDYTWQDWVDEYIRESKRILTVRRNTRAFSLLQEWGCDVIERRGNIDIELSEYDLDYPKSEAYSDYGEVHAGLCTELMMESVQRAGHDELLSIDGPTIDEFIQYLEEAE
jgi:prophage maintenance system killer protein